MSPPCIYFNIFVIFVLSGIWHGANWTFVIWGLIHAMVYTFYFIFIGSKQQKRKEWNAQNKDKLALYARNQYHRRVEKDPEYRKVLSERVIRNRNDRMKKTQVENKGLSI